MFFVLNENWALVGTLNYNLPAQFSDLTGKTLKASGDNIHLSTVIAYGQVPIWPDSCDDTISFTQFDVERLRAVRGVGFSDLTLPSLKLNPDRIQKAPKIIDIEFCENHPLLANLLDSLRSRH